MSIINPIENIVTPPYEAPFKPVPQVTPFTIRDGMTLLKKVDYTRKYIERTLIPFLNKTFPELASSFETEVNTLITKVNTALYAQDQRLDVKISDLETMVNEAVQDIINSAIIVQRPVIENVVDKTIVIADSARFTNIYPGQNVDSTAGMQAALTAAMDKGGRLYVPNGAYRMNSAWNALKSDGTKGDMLIDFAPGAKIIQNGNQPVIDIYGTSGPVYNVASIVEADENVTGTGSDTSTVRVVTITLANGVTPNYSLGDRVKLFADNTIPGGRAGDGTKERRVGADFIVISSIGSVVKVAGRLARYDWTFTLNPRLVKFGDEQVEINGGIFDSNAFTSNVIGFMRFTGLNHPKVRGAKILRAASVAIQFRSCYNYIAGDIEIDFGRNNPASSGLGYGILDTASSFGKVYNVHGTLCRHVWTDDNNGIDALSDDIWHYGSTWGATISNSTGYETLSEAFSPHANSRYVTFENCKAIGGAGGFAIRGMGHTYKNIEAIGCTRGITGFSETGTNTAVLRSVIDGAIFRGIVEDAIRLNKNYNGPSAGQRVTAMDNILNVVIEDAHASSITLVNCAVMMDNIVMHLRQSPVVTVDGVIDRSLVTCVNSTVRGMGGKLTVVAYAVTGGTDMQVINAVEGAQGAGSWKGLDIAIYGSQAQTERFAYIQGGSQAFAFEGNVYSEAPLIRPDFMTARQYLIGNTGDPGVSSRLSDTRVSYTIGQVSGKPDINQNYIEVSDAQMTDPAFAAWISIIDTPLLNIFVNCTSYADAPTNTVKKKLFKLLPPAQQGAIYQIIHTGNVPFDIGHGQAVYGTSLVPAQDFPFTTTQTMLKLQWRGANFRTIA